MLARPDTKARGRFCVKRCGPSHRRLRTASAVLKNFARQPEKTVFNSIGTKRTYRVRSVSAFGGKAENICSHGAFPVLTQKRHHPDEARAAGRSAIPCYPTPIDFIEEARPLPRRVLRSPSGGPSTSSGPCAIFKRSGLAVGCPRVAQMYGPALGDV